MNEYRKLKLPYDFVYFLKINDALDSYINEIISKIRANDNKIPRNMIKLYTGLTTDGMNCLLDVFKFSDSIKGFDYWSDIYIKYLKHTRAYD